MRPHTRTQCTNGKHCSQCYPCSTVVTGSSGHGRPPLIVELPAEILVKIVSYMSFKEITQLRMVSRRFNEICASMLNSTFTKIQNHMLQRFQNIKSQMPRRESLRRNHPLAREADIVETLHMRLTLLQMTFGKHIERKHVCFFPGEILDEVQKILLYIRQTPSLGRAYKVTDELFDLSTMAMEYFKEHIEPTLPEISYFGSEFLDFATPFTTPTKRRSQSGSTSAASLMGIESPCSSRASVAGSNASDVWSTASGSTIRYGTNISRRSGPLDGSTLSADDDYLDDDVGDLDEYFTAPAPPPPPSSQSTMVLRKRIRRIRQGMKKYNTQLGEVKRELKSCKAKMESQNKQVQDYSQRLEEYDKKFEESSRKFQTLLTELNKCKTELQYWRSKSTLLLSLPTTCAQCDAPLIPVASENAFVNPDGFIFADLATLNDMNDLKTLANQGVFPVPSPPHQPEGFSANDGDMNSVPSTSFEQVSPPMKTRSRPNSPSGKSGKTLGGPPSPQPCGRKRRLRDEIEDASNCPSSEATRKSLRGNSSASVATSTRAKRPKLNVQQ